jgi:hypothetical protein
MLTQEQVNIANNAAKGLDALVKELDRLDEAGLEDTAEELTEYLHNVSERGIRTQDEQ